MFPWMMPGPWMGQEQQPQRFDAQVPVRVLKAMEFLEMLTEKTMDRPVANEMSIQTVPGQKLTTEEETVQCTALSLLNKYFAGQLPPDQYERVRLDAMQSQQRRMQMDNKKFMLIQCVKCGTNPVPTCQLCEGTGAMLVTSARGMPGADPNNAIAPTESGTQDLACDTEVSDEIPGGEPDDGSADEG
jgi:hypothetical protein